MDVEYPADYKYLSQFVGRDVEVTGTNGEQFTGYAWRVDPPPESGEDVSVLFVLRSKTASGGRGFPSDLIAAIRIL